MPPTPPNMQNLDRRQLLSAVATVATVSFTLAKPRVLNLGQITQTGNATFLGPITLSRRYTALVAGVPRKSIKLSVGLPCPGPNGLEGSCWASKVVLQNLDPNPATGFGGGSIAEIVQAEYPVPCLLMALDRARILLSASNEFTVGTVVASEAPYRPNLSLPIGLGQYPPVEPCDPASTLSYPLYEGPNPRILNPEGAVQHIGLIHDLKRTVGSSNPGLVRILYGAPEVHQGPREDVQGAICTVQVQGLQPMAASAWTDGIRTVTVGGYDGIDAMLQALIVSHAIVRKSPEGRTSGALHWPGDPSGATLGLPQFVAADYLSPADQQAFLAQLPSNLASRCAAILNHDWAAYFAG
jgi:hypothetical protein